MDSPPVPSELLADIFLRLPDPADLVRASAACVPFRRLVTDRSFLRRYRKLHAPPLLGFLEGVPGYDTVKFHPAAAPYPSASAAKAVALAADFSFSFLPAPSHAWLLQDVRDGRVLLHREAADEDIFTEIVVCDPLHRRYLLLPPIPDDLAAPVEEPFPQLWGDIFLAPPGPGDDLQSDAADAEETSFRVIRITQCQTELLAFVFTSGTGQWRAIPSQRLTTLLAGLAASRGITIGSRQYSCGCFYWRAGCLGQESHMLVLDTRTMEFTLAEPPSQAKPFYASDIGMVEGSGGSSPGMFVHTRGESTLSYYSLIKHQNVVVGASLGQWHKEKTISLDTEHSLICSTQRYLLLYKALSSLRESGFHTLDTKTFQLQKMFHASVYSFNELRAYSNFPPSFLSLPTISSGVEMRRRWKRVALQAQARSHHGPSSADADAGAQADAC